MKKQYVLNKKTGTLHFFGCCTYINNTVEKDSNYACYSSENEAKQKNAISVKWCKVCAKKREQKMKKGEKNVL